jgi:ankyrin repeat protein
MKFKLLFRIVAYVFVALGSSCSWAGAYEDYFRAVAQDNGPAMIGLLQRGLDPNTRDEQGQVGLYLALRAGSFSVAQALLAAPGLEVDALNPAGETPLMIAALRGQAEWVEKLLARGARVHQEGWSPVLYAASAPDAKVLGLLLDRGAQVNARAPNGTTPLMMAARYGSEAAVDLLLARGADPTLRNDRQLRAGDFARQGGRDALARRLDELAR